MSKEAELSEKMRSHVEFTMQEKLAFVAKLSLPGILAQIAEILMQYIDSAMVGRLGASASAAIGLVASSTWLLGGIISAAAYGFSVQVAHCIGAGEEEKARNVFRQSLIACTLFSCILAILGTWASFFLPAWLGAERSIWADASSYIRIFCLFIPVRELYYLSMSMLQCSGSMKVPSLLSVLMCASDVFFNYLLIFPSSHTGFLYIPGADLKVTGAALGTAFSYVLCSLLMLYHACIRSPLLSLKIKGSWKLEKPVLSSAVSIGVPLGLEQAALSLAQICSTRIIAPLGTIAIAAHSFAVTAESFCYMPGYGIGTAATTLVGQAFGAERKDLAKSFAWICTFSGMVIMGAAGIIMYYASPAVFSFLTPDDGVQKLGVECLRIELHAEPLFAASIVAAGALRGAGDTMIPFLLNMASIWGIRITLAYSLTRTIGLPGAWYAMCIELCARGTFFLIRLARGKWLDKMPAAQKGGAL